MSHNTLFLSPLALLGLHPTQRALQLALAFLLLSPTSQVAATEPDPQRLFRLLTLTQMDEALSSLEYDHEEIGHAVWRVVMGDFNAIVFHDFTSIRLYAAFDTEASLGVVNRWNIEKRFSKAHVDDEGDPVLESDLDLSPGVTLDTVQDFFRTFEASIILFSEHLLRIRP
jgi:hypothetical protein